VFDPMGLSSNRFRNERLNAWDNIAYAVLVWSFIASLVVMLVNPGDIQQPFLDAIRAVPGYLAPLLGIAFFWGIRGLQVGVLWLLDRRTPVTVERA
jgi:hypothetical protein